MVLAWTGPESVANTMPVVEKPSSVERARESGQLGGLAWSNAPWQKAGLAATWPVLASSRRSEGKGTTPALASAITNVPLLVATLKVVRSASSASGKPSPPWVLSMSWKVEGVDGGAPCGGEA